MKISKYIHSCVLIEEGDDSILIDPGIFSFKDERVTPEHFSSVKLILITHNHGDHFDAEAVQTIASASGAPVMTTPEIEAVLKEKGFSGTVLTDMEYTVGSISVTAIPAEHEQILAPLPTNYGYLINGRVLHPGDSYSSALSGHGADVLLLPIIAPWATEPNAFAFAERIAPKKVIPIHDGYVKDFFMAGSHQRFKNGLEPLGIEFIPLIEPGDSTEF